MDSASDFVVGVHQLLGRYCTAILRNNTASVAETWTADAVWCIPGAKLVEGREAIVRTFSRIRSTYVLCVQEILNTVVDVRDGRSATGTVQIRELQWRPDGTGSELIGVYHDEVVRADGDRCQFHRRDFELLYDGPVAMLGRLRPASGALDSGGPRSP
jgi:SnoaL-like domain